MFEGGVAHPAQIKPQITQTEKLGEAGRTNNSCLTSIVDVVTYDSVV